MNFNKFNLNSGQIKQFDIYYDFLISENKKYNLTAITSKEEVYIKHFHDSMMSSFVFDYNKIHSYCDIGSGGGFPAVPLKIVFPHLKLTVIEPTKKKIDFLKRLCELLLLSEIEFVNQRAEDFIKERREYYDIITARAVAKLPVLLELAIPLLKVQGTFIAYKGINYYSELKEANTALQLLGSNVDKVYKYSLPNNMGEHVIIKIRKQRKTDRVYPRRYAQIKKKHL